MCTAQSAAEEAGQGGAVCGNRTVHTTETAPRPVVRLPDAALLLVLGCGLALHQARRKVGLLFITGHHIPACPFKKLLVTNGPLRRIALDRALTQDYKGTKQPHPRRARGVPGEARKFATLWRAYNARPRGLPEGGGV